MYFTVKCNQIILDERHYLSVQKRVVSERKIGLTGQLDQRQS